MPTVFTFDDGKTEYTVNLEVNFTPDDLSKIDLVGVATAQLLYSEGLMTYQQFIDASDETLEPIIRGDVEAARESARALISGKGKAAKG